MPLAPANAAGAFGQNDFGQNDFGQSDFGLYPASDFRLTTGECRDCAAIRQALWYFRDQTIGVPVPGRAIAGFTTGVRAIDDVRDWAAARRLGAAIDYPPLVWVAAPEIVRKARLSADATRLVTGEGDVAFRPSPKIPLNRSYYDASSVAFFKRRTLTARGTPTAEGFIARSLWPEDFYLRGSAPPARAIPAKRSAALGLRSLMREEPRGGARSPYATCTLWQKTGAPREWAGRPVLAFMVNGAQGDDDAAHGGHFALVTGRVQADGRISNWLVNNFYSLDVESEKGILAAPVPLDNYLSDLNSGQGWYRPSYMVVAVLKDERAAALVQSALNRTYNQFWRHQLVYYHPNENCTSISVDTLRALVWNVPARGPASRTLAWLGFPFIAAKELPIGKAKPAFDYLYPDQTRLMPAAALEEILGSLLGLANGGIAGDDGPLARMLNADMEALAFVR